LSLVDINCYEELPETNPTLQENALQKAKYIFDNYGFNCFADDTGLEIDILGGEPGVYSARYAGYECNAEKNIKKVLDKLEKKSQRVAQFRTLIALIINRKQIDESIQLLIIKYRHKIKNFIEIKGSTEERIKLVKGTISLWYL